MVAGAQAIQVESSGKDQYGFRLPIHVPERALYARCTRQGATKNRINTENPYKRERSLLDSDIGAQALHGRVSAIFPVRV